MRRLHRCHSQHKSLSYLHESQYNCNPLIPDVRITVSVLDTAYKIDLNIIYYITLDTTVDMTR